MDPNDLVRRIQRPPGVLRAEITMDVRPQTGHGAAAVRWTFNQPISAGLRLYLIALLYARILATHTDSRATLVAMIEALSKRNIQDEGALGFPFPEWPLILPVGPPQWIWPWDQTRDEGSFLQPRKYIATLQAHEPKDSAPYFGIHLQAPLGDDGVLAPASVLLAIDSYFQSTDQRACYELSLLLWQIGEFYGSRDQVHPGQESDALTTAMANLKSATLQLPRWEPQSDQGNIVVSCSLAKFYYDVFSADKEYQGGAENPFGEKLVITHFVKRRPSQLTRKSFYLIPSSVSYAPIHVTMARAMKKHGVVAIADSPKGSTLDQVVLEPLDGAFHAIYAADRGQSSPPPLPRSLAEFEEWRPDRASEEDSENETSACQLVAAMTQGTREVTESPVPTEPTYNKARVISLIDALKSTLAAGYLPTEEGAIESDQNTPDKFRSPMLEHQVESPAEARLESARRSSTVTGRTASDRPGAAKSSSGISTAFVGLSNIVTASMLYDFLQCPHRVTLELCGDPRQRDQIHPFVELLWERGHAREREVMERLDVPFLNLRTIFDPDEREERTYAAMLAGRQLIYGGRIRHQGLLGEPDILRRSGAGYVPGDIKSGAGVEGGSEDSDGKPKKHYAVQLAFYVDILQKLGMRGSGRPFIWDVHGNEVTYDLASARGKRMAETMAEEYEAVLASVRSIISGSLHTTPAMVAACKLCRWRSHCSQQLERDDDLTLIPELGRARRDGLLPHVRRVEAFANANLDDLIVGEKTVVPGLGPTMLERFHARARLQKQPNAKPYFSSKVALPSSRLELFFDLETDPMQDVCYLHGFISRERGDSSTERYVGFFAGTSAAEKDAFRRAWNYIITTRPTALYFYSTYERTIYLHLARRFPEIVTPEKVQALFASNVAFDLYEQLVRSSMEWPTHDLSIKTVATYLGFRWRDPEPSGAASVRWYHEWKASGDPRDQQRIVKYNEDDCRAMRVLVDATRALQRRL